MIRNFGIIGFVCLFLFSCTAKAPSPPPPPPPVIISKPPPPPPKPNAEVKWAQEALLKQGYTPGPADGLMGSRTRDALQQFQRDLGLSKTGKIDDATKAALRQSSAGTTQVQEPAADTSAADTPAAPPEADSND